MRKSCKYGPTPVRSYETEDVLPADHHLVNKASMENSQRTCCELPASPGECAFQSSSLESGNTFMGNRLVLAARWVQRRLISRDQETAGHVRS